MTKKEISKTIAKKVDLPAVIVHQIVQMVFDGIVDAIVEESGIELRNFGVFQVRRRRARMARNPRTGETVAVPARNVVSFKPGLALAKRARSVREDTIAAVEPIADGEGDD